MGARQLWVWLLATALITIVAMVLGARADNRALAYGAGGMFLFATIFAAGQWDRLEIAAGTSPAQTSVRYANLFATVWGWSGLAMLTSYLLTDLHWQHAWQYGSAMLLIAAGLVYLAMMLGRLGSDPSAAPLLQAARWATIAQGIAAAGAVLWLMASGKLQAGGVDWAANIVFIVGGGSIAQLSFMGIRAEQRAIAALRSDEDTPQP